MDLVECTTCYALVRYESLPDHREWHTDSRTFIP